MNEDFDMLGMGDEGGESGDSDMSDDDDNKKKKKPDTGPGAGEEKQECR